jgi:hypothetical protein
MLRLPLFAGVTPVTLTSDTAAAAWPEALSLKLPLNMIPAKTPPQMAIGGQLLGGVKDEHDSSA